jgi:hypothetical protein
MPSTSKKQHNFMAAVANNPAFAKKAGVPQSVGQDFTQADKGRKFAKGGDMKESKAMMKKEVGFMKKAGAPKSMVKHEMAEAGMKKMASGGMAMVMKDGKKVPAFAADGEGKMKQGGAVKKMNMGGMGYAKGGMPDALAKHAAKPASKAHAGLKAGGSVFRKTADGIAKKGKTKAAQVKMAGGGMYKNGGMC